MQEVLRTRIGDYAVVGLDVRLGRIGRLFGIVDVGGLEVRTWNDAAGQRTSVRYGFTEPGPFMVFYLR